MSLSTTTPGKRRRSEIPPQVKREIVMMKTGHPKMTHRDLREFVKENFALDVGKSTLCDILKEKDRWLSVSETDVGTRMRKNIIHKELEAALLLWVSKARIHHLPISNNLLLSRARQLGNRLGVKGLQYSRGWLARFKQRNGIVVEWKNSSERAEGSSSDAKRLKLSMDDIDQIGAAAAPSGDSVLVSTEQNLDESGPVKTEVVKLEPEDDVDVAFEQNHHANTNLVKAPNPHLSSMKKDVLYHIAMDTETHNFKEMFSDVKFVCFGGSRTRMENFARSLVKELKVHMPAGMTLENIAKGSDRYVMYKVGPVLSVSHGMGIPSISIIFHEVVKLLHYAQCTDVVFLRIGTCGGLGLLPGSVVISECAVDGAMCPYMEVISLGKVQHYPSTLDEGLAEEIMSLCDAEEDGFETLIGKTMCTLDFYEGQARLDGAFCNYTEEDKMEFLHHIYNEGVRNIEMESLCFAAYCNRANIKGAVVCVTLLDRLEGDQLDMPHAVMEDWQARPQTLITSLMKKRLGIF